MKKARRSDFLRYLENKEFSNSINVLDYSDIKGMGSDLINLENGLNVFCGLNGVGKTTLASAFKVVLERNSVNNRSQLLRLQETKIKSIIKTNGDIIENAIEIDKEYNLINKTGSDISSVIYLDVYAISSIIKFFRDMENVSELIEQYEANLFDDDSIKEISYIVGKDYEKCIVYDIDDYGETDPKSYFIVQSYGEQYSTETMGLGEHSLLYIYWKLKSIPKKSILIIEEPETYISSQSQIKFIDVLIKYIVQNDLFCIVTSHSPTVLTNIPCKNIKLMYRDRNIVKYHLPESVSDYKKFLGIDLNKRGAIFVEDFVSYVFAKSIISTFSTLLLHEFDLEILNGEGDILKALDFPILKNCKFKILGLFDGDLRNEIKTKKNWPYCFLPQNSAPEILLKDEIINNQESFSKLLNIDQNKLSISISNLSGRDHHDWFIELSKEICIDFNIFIKASVQLWMMKPENELIAKSFYDELMTLLYSDDDD